MAHRPRLLRQVDGRGRVRPAQRSASAAAAGKQGPEGEPPACVIDAQSVKTSTSVPAQNDF
ncbi:hypothetical protein [Streptomyces sp. OM5714]|uniref:hypothetical protein n=1 Tax=Streptomyces sp. OM5714 TaxID=2602736 RepID=UPI003204C330